MTWNGRVHCFLLDHWGETLLKTGVSIEHMMDVVAHWLSGSGAAEGFVNGCGPGEAFR